MFLTLDSFFNDEPTAIVQVDSSAIDVSEFQDEEDQSFLITHGNELLRIDAKAEQAKEQICKAIDQRAEDAKGRLIYEIQERFNSSPELKGGLMRYFHSLGYWVSNMEKMGLEKPAKYQALSSAFRWANAYRAALEMQEKLAGELPAETIQQRAGSLATQSLAKIYTSLSTEDRERIYKEVCEGKNFSAQEVNEMVKDPTVKLSKAEELLAKARARKEEAEERWEQAEVKGDLRHDVRNASDEIDRHEAKIAELQKQVEAKEAELKKFKHDTEFARQEWIKLLTDALTVGVPQATADLNKYIADADYYPEPIRKHMDEQIKVLADMCGDYLSRI